MKEWLLLILMGLILVSCCRNTETEKYTVSELIENKLADIEKYIDLECIETNIYCDKNTGVMYFKHYYGLSPILESDGTPKLYESD